MTYTAYVDYNSGATLYVKPRPTVAAPWPDDAVAGAENGTTGEYTFAALADATSYRVYEQAGATPAATDPVLFRIEPGAATDLTPVLDELAKVIKTGEQFIASGPNDIDKDVTFSRVGG